MLLSKALPVPLQNILALPTDTADSSALWTNNQPSPIAQASTSDTGEGAATTSQTPSLPWPSYQDLAFGSNPNRVDGRLPNDITAHVNETAGIYGLNAIALGLLVDLESSGRVDAQSSNGYKGLMQLGDAELRAQGVTNWRDPQQNLRGGVRNLLGKKSDGTDADGNSPLQNVANILGVPESQVPVWAIYFPHLQGSTGGPALLEAYGDPSKRTRKAHEVIHEAVQIANPGSRTNAANNIASNLPQEYVNAHGGNRQAIAQNITVEEFVNAWRSRIGPDGDIPFLRAPQTDVAES